MAVILIVKPFEGKICSKTHQPQIILLSVFQSWQIRWPRFLDSLQSQKPDKNPYAYNPVHIYMGVSSTERNKAYFGLRLGCYSDDTGAAMFSY